MPILESRHSPTAGQQRSVSGYPGMPILESCHSPTAGNAYRHSPTAGNAYLGVPSQSNSRECLSWSPVIVQQPVSSGACRGSRGCLPWSPVTVQQQCIPVSSEVCRHSPVNSSAWWSAAERVGVAGDVPLGVQQQRVLGLEVSTQVHLPLEGAAAVRACEGLEARVLAAVGDEVGALAERLAALLALVGLLACNRQTDTRWSVQTDRQTGRQTPVGQYRQTGRQTDTRW